MAIIAIGSLHGSPGATTLAVELVRSCGADALLIEADPDGGCLAARLDLAIKPGLTELAGAARVGVRAEDLWRFAQRSVCGVAVVVAHPASEQVHAALRAAASNIGAAASALSSLGHHIVIDIGRIRSGSPALGLAAAADHVLVLIDNSAEAVVTVTHRTQLLSGFSAVAVVLSDAKPYTADEIEAASGQAVWGVVPHGRTRRGKAVRVRALQQMVDEFFPDLVPELETPQAETPQTETPQTDVLPAAVGAPA